MSEELDNAISHPKRACDKQGSSPERQNRSEGGSRPGLAACMLGSPGEPESSRACLGICQGSKHLTERLGKFPQRAAAISTHGFKCKVSGSQSQVPGGRALARLCFAHPEEPMTSNMEHVLDADSKVGGGEGSIRRDSAGVYSCVFHSRRCVVNSQQARWQAQSKQSLTWRGGSLWWVRWPRPIGDGQGPARRTVAKIPNNFQLLL